MFLSKLVIPFGIFTWTVMVLAVLTGRRIIKVKLIVHKTLAWIGISSATIHGLIFIYLNYF
jgi:hypothetical protein